MGKKLRSSLFGVLVLTVGVLMGILLVSQTTSFKNKAKESLDKTYVVCHKMQFEPPLWEEIEVTADELPVNVNNGDIFGGCPEELLFPQN